MAKKVQPRQQFLEWLVGRRNDIQHSCYDLLKLLNAHRSESGTKGNSFIAQALVGAAFSLWRAVFLADKESRVGIPLKHSISFLERIVRTNTIAFSQELDTNEWTFNYYLFNAESRLRAYPTLTSQWVGTRPSSMDRWDYCHRKLREAIRSFADRLAKE